MDDAEYFLRDIINFGPAYGAVLNLKKTRAVLTLNGHDLQPLYSERAQVSIKHILVILEQNPVFDVFKVLGILVGTPTFVTT